MLRAKAYSKDSRPLTEQSVRSWQGGSFGSFVRTFIFFSKHLLNTVLFECLLVCNLYLFLQAKEMHFEFMLNIMIHSGALRVFEMVMVHLFIIKVCKVFC